MTDPFDGLRSHGRRTPPSLDPVLAAGTRRRRLAMGWASGGVTAAVAAVAVVVTMSGGPATARHDTLGADPTTSVEPTASPTAAPVVPPSRTPMPTPLASGPVSVRLSFATGTADGLYGLEHVGDTGTSGFHVVRVDPTTLEVQRSALISGTEGGLAVDNQAVYVTAVDSASVLRFAPTDLAPLPSWGDPVGTLAGPVVATRSGLWVVDAHGLTQLVGDGQAGGESTERSPERILLAAGYSTPDLLANDFWAVVLDDKDCPTLYHATGPDGLGSSPKPVYRGDCALGFASLAATPQGVLVSTPTGTMGGVNLLTPDGAAWRVARGPAGSNGITPSAAGQRLFASDQGELMCLDPQGRTLATVPVAGSLLAKVVRAGGRDLLVVAGPGAERVEPYTADPACG